MGAITTAIAATAAGKAIDRVFPAKTDYTGMQKGIQWRVEDAKKAGIHPLYAMGANIGSPTVTAGSAGADLAKGVVQSGMTRNKGMEAQTIKESEARILASQAQAKRDVAYAMKADSEAAQISQGLSSNQDYSVQDKVIDPRPRAIIDSGGKKVFPGKGSPGQRGEDEYGEAWEIQNLIRYLRDVAWPDTLKAFDYTKYPKAKRSK